MNGDRQRAWLSWGFAALLLLLCGFLAFIQNRWINELGNAERARLQQELQTGLSHLSRDFNTEIEAAVSVLLPSAQRISSEGREQAYSDQYQRWKPSHPALFSRIALVVPSEEGIAFESLNFETGKFGAAQWPSDWIPMRDQMLSRLGGRFGFNRPMNQNTALIEVPRFGGPEPGGPSFGPPPFRDRDREHRAPRREQEWVLLELNLDYVRTQMFPELLRTHLASNGQMEYEAEVVVRDHPTEVIFHSLPNPSQEILRAPDVSTTIFDIEPNFARRRPGPPGPGGGGRPGRWLMVVRHREGSLEAVVSRARWQNYATSAGLLLLILATVGTMVRSSRQAEQLARLQMNFVAGVSHELRTPLTVIRTAAYNLRGTLATKPEQVERYGKLIQDESEKLGGLVEQVLRFASSSAGHAIREREPVAVENVINEGIRSSRAAAAGSGIEVETRLDPGLPLILADSQALRHAIQNLLDNAVKYGTEGSNWIGVTASAIHNGKNPAVEIRVSDRGPGIPPEEQQHIFDPFFRGQRAIRDQVHGTGLGLNLVKKIVEAHGGHIRVESEPMQGAAFVMQIPAAPPELQDEFAHSLS